MAPKSGDLVPPEAPESVHQQCPHCRTEFCPVRVGALVQCPNGTEGILVLFALPTLDGVIPEGVVTVDDMVVIGVFDRTIIAVQQNKRFFINLLSPNGNRRAWYPIADYNDLNFKVGSDNILRAMVCNCRLVELMNKWNAHNEAQQLAQV